MAAQKQIMPKIDSKLAFLLKENELVELDAHIAYKPTEKTWKYLEPKKNDSQ